jgi:hypothetical protein
MKRSTNAGGMIFVHVCLCIFLAIGLSCIFAPRWVQACALRWNRDWAPGISNSLLEWMRTDGYVIFLRIMGVVFVTFVSIVEILVVKSLSAQ